MKYLSTLSAEVAKQLGASQMNLIHFLLFQFKRKMTCQSHSSFTQSYLAFTTETRTIERLLFLFFMLFSIQPLSYALDGNDVRFNEVTTSQGLSHDAVFSIYRDSRGFVWLGTQEGLNRFDGHNIKQFLAKPDQPGFLQTDNIRYITEDRDGFLYIGTKEGLQILNPETGVFFNIEDADAASRMASEPVRALISTDIGMLYAGNSGIDVITEQGKKVTPLTQVVEKNGETLTVFESFNAHENGLFFSTDNNQVYHLALNGEFSHIPLNFVYENGDPVPSQSQIKPTSVLVDDKNRLWVGTRGNGLFLFAQNIYRNMNGNALTVIVRPMMAESTSIDSMAMDEKQQLWVGTYSNGIQIINTETLEATIVQNDPTVSDSLSSNEIGSLYYYGDDLMMVGTIKGMQTYNALHSQFSTLTTSNNPSIGMLGNNVSEIAHWRGNEFFISTTYGMTLYDAKTKAVDNITVDSFDNGIQEAAVMALEVVSEDEVWLGYRTAGLTRFNPLNDTFIHYKANKGEEGKLQSDAIPVIYQTRDKTLWVGTYGGGLHRYNRDSGDFTVFTHDESDQNSLFSNLIISIYEDDQGMLWVGNVINGLSIFDPQNGNVKRIDIQNHTEEPVGNVAVWDTIQDANNNYWFATAKGVIKLSYDSYQSGKYEFKAITTLQGMPSNRVYKLLLKDNVIWGSTNRGIVKIDTVNNQILDIYTTNHGLISSEFNSNSAVVGPDGVMYFGGPPGVTYFDPDQVSKNVKTPEIKLVNVQRNKEITDVALSTRNGALVFEHTDDFIRLEFVALDFTGSQPVNYRFNLTGSDSDYFELGFSGVVMLSKLPHGEYTLNITSTNREGVWSENEYSIPITMLPHPALSNQAIIAYLLLFILLIAMIFAAYRRQMRNKFKYHKTMERRLTVKNDALESMVEKFAIRHFVDPMTGVHNKNYLENHLPHMLREAEDEFMEDRRKRTQDSGTGSRLFVLSIDIDSLANINKRFGHQFGDNVIANVGELLQEVCRKDDMVIRYGGDEFLVLGRSLTINDIHRLADRIRQVVAAHDFFETKKRKVPVTISVGFACYPFSRKYPNALSYRQITALSDKAVEYSKNAGGDCVSGLIESAQSGDLKAILQAARDPETGIANGTLHLLRLKADEPSVTLKAS